MMNNTRVILVLVVLFLFGDGFGVKLVALREWGQGREFTCPEPDGFFAPEGQCTGEYYACANNVAMPQQCPDGKVFDPAIQRCVPYEEASCYTAGTTTTRPVTTTTQTRLTTRPGSSVCPEDNGFFPIPGECSSDYYNCVNGSPYVVTCPGEAIFDPVELVCKSPDEVSCRSTTLAPFTCPPGTPGNYPYPGDCTKYFVCRSNGEFIVATCPSGQVFNPTIHFCDNPANVPECNSSRKLLAKLLRHK